MTQTFGSCEALPVNLSQLQRLARSLQEKMQFDPSGRAAGRIAELAPSMPSAATTIFTDRRGAGSLLAAKLGTYVDRADVAIVGVPQGGVPVAAEISRLLRAPLAVWNACKLRAHVPCAGSIGAVAEDGEVIIDEGASQRLRVPPVYMVDEVRACRAEVKRRAELYRPAALFSQLTNRTLIVVDDGAVSGQTLRAALSGLKRRQPRRIVLALPVAPLGVARKLAEEVDEVVVLETTLVPAEVGQYYVHFAPVITDDNVRLLHRHRALTATAR